MADTIRTLAELQAFLEKGDNPTAQQFRDLLVSVLLADFSNWPAVLPVSSAANLTDIPIPDPLPAVDASALLNIAPTEWIVQSGFTVNIIDATHFGTTGDQTGIYVPGRSLRLILDTGTLYTTVASSTYTGGSDTTSVELVHSMGAATTITTADYSNVKPLASQGSITPAIVGLRLYTTNIASAATLALVDGYNSFTVTGANDISALSARPEGEVIRLRMVSTPKFVNSANLSLRDGADWVALENSVLSLESRGSGQYIEIGRSAQAEATKTEVRQTVLTGAVDSDGLANFVTAGTGLAASVLATSVALTLAFASGFSAAGQVDYVGRITADSSDCWSGLTANAQNFLYVDRNTGTGALTYGHTVNLPPVYGETYLKAGGVGRSYSSFDGTDAATAFTDENGVAWTFVSGAQLDTAAKKFGTAALLLGGTSDWVESNIPFHAGADVGGFKVDFWIRRNTTGVNENILGSKSVGHFAVGFNSSNNLQLSLGNGSTWSIGQVASASTFTDTASFHHVRLQWDGATYKLYWDGTEQISISSTSAFATEKSSWQLGAYISSGGFNGWIDDFSYEIGPQTLGAFTPPTTARGSLAADTEHWFNTSTMKLQYWDRATAAWIEKQRVFLGEATTGASTVSSAVTYALKGNTKIAPFAVSATTEYVKSHNLGMANYIAKTLGRVVDSTWNEWSLAAANSGANLTNKLRNSIRLSVHTNPNIISQVDTATTAEEAKIDIYRGW